MQTKPLPEIDSSDVKTVRHFLTSLRDEERGTRAARLPEAPPAGAVTLRNGITRARTRSRTKSEA